ncbi:hypothetical protein Aperf_G00000089358 [Anoplocephala perfoliata]
MSGASRNTLRILLTTDNHVGYLEKDGIRGSDTFKTLEEVLCLAQHHEVDFILQGGDLFHENRPSIRCLNEVLRLVRTYCLNDRPVGFEILSDPTVNFASTAYPEINYLDANLNVGIPVFAIHGNHDDPSGPGNICAPDLLHTCGFINLFGKSKSVENIEVNPVLIKKGSTNLALYGIGAVREERLYRLFRDSKVTFLRPESNVDDWFSLAVVHQNRVRHGPTGYLPEKFLPSFLDLIIWGHEHDCRIVPEWNESQQFYIVQPGSSVATALSEGEAITKCVGLLEIRGHEFHVTKLPLLSSRKFIFEDLVLQDELPDVDRSSPDAAAEVEKLCSAHIESAIDRAVEEVSALLRQRRSSEKTGELVNLTTQFAPPPEPLVRLRVDTSGGFEKFSALRFGQKFVGRVANPKDLIIFNTKRDTAARHNASIATPAVIQSSTGPKSGPGGRVGLAMADVESLISDMLSSDSKLQLGILTETEMASALRQFVDRSDNDAIGSVVDKIITKTRGHLTQEWCPEDRVQLEVNRFAESRKKMTSSSGIVGSGDNSEQHSIISGPVTDTSPTKVEFVDISTSVRQTASKDGRLKQTTLLLNEPLPSDELDDVTSDRMLLESLEAVEEEEKDQLPTDTTVISRDISSRVPISSASTLRGRATATRRGLFSRTSRRGVRATTRGRLMATSIDVEANRIDSEDSNEMNDVRSNCQQKRIRRR